MTVIADAAIVAALVLDIIDMYQKRGVKVDLATLDAELKKQQARRKKVNEGLGI